MLIKLDSGDYINAEHVSVIESNPLKALRLSGVSDWCAIMLYGGTIDLTTADHDRLLQAMEQSPTEQIADAIQSLTWILS